MYKSYLLLISAILAFPAIKAYSGEINALKIHCKSNQDFTILLETYPILKFVESNIEIYTDNTVLNFPSEEAQKITYLSVDPNSVTNIEASEPIFYFTKDCLVLNNLKPLISVSIYSIEGQLLTSTVTDNDGKASMTLPEQSNSVYILQTPTMSFKLHRP